MMVRGSDDDRVHSGVSEQVMVIGVPFSVGGTLQAGLKVRLVDVRHSHAFGPEFLETIIQIPAPSP
jgi:hypothetical protein